MMMALGHFVQAHVLSDMDTQGVCTCLYVCVRVCVRGTRAECMYLEGMRNRSGT